MQDNPSQKGDTLSSRGQHSTPLMLHQRPSDLSPFASTLPKSKTVKLDYGPLAPKTSIYLPVVEENKVEAKGFQNPTGYNNCFINVVI